MKRHTKNYLTHAVNPGFHAFSTTVANTPVEHLYWNGYQLQHTRRKSLDEERLSSLLESRPELILVSARPGKDYRWYDRGDYRFWLHVAKGNVANPDATSEQTDDGSTRYCASMWCTKNSEDDIILLEQK